MSIEGLGDQCGEGLGSYTGQCFPPGQPRVDVSVVGSVGVREGDGNRGDNVAGEATRSWGEVAREVREGPSSP